MTSNEIPAADVTFPTDDRRPKVSAGFIALLAFGLFGTYLAFVTPIAISLAIRVKALSPITRSTSESSSAWALSRRCWWGRSEVS